MINHDREYLGTLRHDQPNTPTHTGIEVIAECEAYHEHMSKQALAGFTEFLARELFDNGATDYPMKHELKCSVRRFIEKSFDKYTKEQ